MVSAGMSWIKLPLAANRTIWSGAKLAHSPFGTEMRTLSHVSQLQDSCGSDTSGPVGHKSWWVMICYGEHDLLVRDCVTQFCFEPVKTFLCSIVLHKPLSVSRSITSSGTARYYKGLLVRVLSQFSATTMLFLVKYHEIDIFYWIFCKTFCNTHHIVSLSSNTHTHADTHAMQGHSTLLRGPLAVPVLTLRRKCQFG